MTPKRIILIRHGQSTANVDESVCAEQPDPAHPLTPEGERQAAVAGERLAGIIKEESFGVFVSPYRRTMQTMEFACAQLPRIVAFTHQDPRLREQDYGPMRSVDESKRQREQRALHGRFFYRFPGGESCADVFDRMSAFLETLHRRFQRDDFPDNILVFTHGTAMRCFLTRWYHWTVDRFEEMENHPPNCHIVVMQRTESVDTYEISEPFESVFLPRGL